VSEGLPVHDRTLNTVIDEYLAPRTRDNQLGKTAKRGGSDKHRPKTDTEHLASCCRLRSHTGSVGPPRRRGQPATGAWRGAFTDAEGRSNVQLHVMKGKTGKRIVVPHIEVQEIIEAMLALRGEPKPEDLLFATPSHGRLRPGQKCSCQIRCKIACHGCKVRAAEVH
jgi:hypothetical protein